MHFWSVIFKMTATPSLDYIKSIKNAVTEMMKVQTSVISFVKSKESIDSLSNILQQNRIIDEKYKFYDFLEVLNSMYSKYKFNEPKKLIEQLILSMKTQIFENFTETEIYHMFNREIYHFLYDSNTTDNKSTEKVESIQNNGFKFNVNQESNQEDETLSKIIRSDDIDSFTTLISRTNLPLDSKVFDSTFESSRFVCNSLIDYSAAVGSINIFKYLYNHLDVFPNNTLSSAVIGENYEIIHLLENKGFKPSRLAMSFIISYYKNELFDYFISSYPIELDFRTVEKSITSHNYYVLNELLEKNPEFLTNIEYINEMFSIASCYDIRTLFNILYSIPDLDVNVSLEVFFFF